MIILCLTILTILLWIGYHITGALLAAIIWLCIKLPCAIIVCCQPKDRTNGENVEPKPKRGKKPKNAADSVADPDENAPAPTAKQPSDPSGNSPASNEK